MPSPRRANRRDTDRPRTRTRGAHDSVNLGAMGLPGSAPDAGGRHPP
ncbi:hypothetical protein ACKI10_34535 [Streptomyces galilaeus]|uniref:Uncharacterized protein n=1 Tax=Streptomyces galilaeus TaxID=33899 RepID=A0ABW9IL48_STRGJ